MPNFSEDPTPDELASRSGKIRWKKNQRARDTADVDPPPATKWDPARHPNPPRPDPPPTIDYKAALEQAEKPKRKKRGRPKGSKNKKTLLREAQEQKMTKTPPQKQKLAQKKQRKAAAGAASPSMAGDPPQGRPSVAVSAAPVKVPGDFQTEYQRILLNPVIRGGLFRRSLSAIARIRPEDMPPDLLKGMMDVHEAGCTNAKLVKSTVSYLLEVHPNWSSARALEVICVMWAWSVFSSAFTSLDLPLAQPPAEVQDEPCLLDGLDDEFMDDDHIDAEFEEA